MSKFPAIKLSKQELQDCLEIMRKGNTRLKRLAEIANMEHKAFRAKLFKRPFDASNWPEFGETDIAYLIESLPYIQGVRNIEGKMLAAYTPLVIRHAKNWARRMQFTTADYDDFFQEASMALLDSIYSYTEEDTAFMTFAWHVITRRLYTVTNKNSPLTPLTNQAIKLVKLYEKTLATFNEPVTDSIVYAKMNLTDEELVVLQAARVCVLNDSQVNNNPHHSEAVGGFNGIGDYTAIRRGIDNEKDTVSCHFEVYDAIDKADLNEMERKVILTSMNPYYGWQTDLAKTTYNPRTKKPYTKMTINNILHSALEKVKAVYTKRNVA